MGNPYLRDKININSEKRKKRQEHQFCESANLSEVKERAF